MRPESDADSDLMEVEPRVGFGRTAIRDVEQTVRKLGFDSLANRAAETRGGHQLGVESRGPVIRNRAEEILQSGGNVDKRTEWLAVVESSPNSQWKRAYTVRVAVLGQDQSAPDPYSNYAPIVDPVERRDDNQVGDRSEDKPVGSMQRVVPPEA